MSHPHWLADRTEDEVLWHRRRSFLGAAAAWTALGGFASAQAQSRSNIVELQGEALLNGQRLRPEHTIQTGDQISTGPATTLVFVVGNSSFLVRQNSQMSVERGNSINAVSVLRLLAGAVASVWGRGGRRTIVTPTLTAGIRGTGVYTEARPQEGGRSYFCNCYGTVDLAADTEQRTSIAEYHQAFWAETAPREGRMLRPAPAINHTDEELEMLARLVGQRTAWQIKGRRGTKDAQGYPVEQPGTAAPAR